MKFKILATIVAAFSVPAVARVKPITAAESGRILQYGQHPKLVDCMAVYKFDFFSSQLGLALDDVGEEAQLVQFRIFLNDTKLEQRDPKQKLPKELKVRCAIIAETAVELVALKLLGKPQEQQDKSQNN